MTSQTTSSASPLILDRASQMALANEFLRRTAALVMRESATTGGAAIQWPGRFDSSWAQRLPLPIGEHRQPGQTIALASGLQFDRPDDPAEAMATRPRTQIYESVEVRSEGNWWIKSVVEQLMRLTRVEVVCSIYASERRAATLNRHCDLWNGLLLQVSGEKTIELWTPDGLTSQIITMRPGDVLWLPYKVPHNMWTNDHSVHVQFAMLIEKPLALKEFLRPPEYPD
jgi:hypothetical protein